MLVQNKTCVCPWNISCEWKFIGIWLGRPTQLAFVENLDPSDILVSYFLIVPLSLIFSLLTQIKLTYWKMAFTPWIVKSVKAKYPSTHESSNNLQNPLAIGLVNTFGIWLVYCWLHYQIQEELYQSKKSVTYSSINVGRRLIVRTWKHWNNT